MRFELVRHFVTVLLLCCSSEAMALTPDDCTFYAPFDGAFDAARARGSAKASVKGSMRFVPGIRGQGILVGGPGTELSFETKGNLSLEAGSVAVWVKPETWSDSDAAMRHFFTASESASNLSQDGGTYFMLYRFFAQSTYFLVWDSRGYPTLTAADPKQFPDVFKKGEWVHLCGTWNGDEIRLFVNGKLQSASRVATPRILRSLGPRFTVGGASRANAADTVLDELRLLNRALTASEASALYHNSLTASADAQELTAVRLPTAKKVRVDINAIGHRPDEAGRLSARVALRPKAGGRPKGTVPLQELTVAHFGSQHEVAEFSTAEIPPGEYRVISHLFDNGKEIAVSEAPLVLRPSPPWLGAREEVRTASVPRPWTAVEASGEGPGLTVSCWGPRRYVVGDALFPTGLATPTAEILSGPITLSGIVNGKKLALGPAKTTWKSQTPARAEFASAARDGGLTVSTEQFLEYDGLLWIWLRLSGEASLTVSRLMLEIPLKQEAVTLMQTGFSSDDAGAVHKWSHRVLANAQVWLGNEEGGLQWTIPSARNWRNADRNRQIEIAPEPGRVVLQLNLVDKESAFDGPIEYEFGAQLTPVRPHPKGWRMWRITPAQETPGTRFLPFYTEGWAVGTSYPIPQAGWEKIYTDETKKGNLATLYLQPFSVWPGMPDYPDFAAEWRTRLTSPPPAADAKAPATSFMGVCPRAHSWSDYFVNTFCDLYQGKYKDMGWGAVYFDVTPTPACDNADHGCGYRDEYGAWQPEQRYLEHREVQRRFYLALGERWPGKLLVNHESGTLDMTQLSHCDGMIDGEHLTLALPPENFNYHKILTLDRMRAEYMGHNFGFVPIFLPEFTRASAGNAAVTNRFMTTPESPEVMHLVGLLFLHDILPWDAYSHPGPYFHLWAVEDAFGWGDDVEWLPYWKNRDLVTLVPADPNIVCTLYRRPGKVLAVVMNNTDTDRNVGVALELKRLGIPAETAKAVDAWKAAGYKSPHFAVNAQGTAVPATQPLVVAGVEEPIPLAAGRMTIKVGKRNFRVVSIVAGSG